MKTKIRKAWNPPVAQKVLKRVCCILSGSTRADALQKKGSSWTRLVYVLYFGWDSSFFLSLNPHRYSRYTNRISNTADTGTYVHINLSSCCTISNTINEDITLKLSSSQSQPNPRIPLLMWGKEGFTSSKAFETFSSQILLHSWYGEPMGAFYTWTVVCWP